jgi:hypothetical protein
VGKFPWEWCGWRASPPPPRNPFAAGSYQDPPHSLTPRRRNLADAAYHARAKLTPRHRRIHNHLVERAPGSRYRPPVLIYAILRTTPRRSFPSTRRDSAAPEFEHRWMLANGCLMVERSRSSRPPGGIPGRPAGGRAPNYEPDEAIRWASRARRIAAASRPSNSGLAVTFISDAVAVVTGPMVKT